MAKSETTDILIQIWENSIRTNDMKPLPQKFFSYTAEQNHEEACYLFRYVFEKILDWTPYDALNYLNEEIVTKLNLKKAYNNFNWPEELDKGRSSYYYVAAMCYPDIITDYNEHNLWIMEYNQLLSKVEADNKKSKEKNAKPNRISPNSFTIDNGYDKARFLLNHYLVTHPNEEFTDLETTYEKFANSAFANKFLSNIKLNGACKIFFGTPLEFFHQSLPNDGDDEFSRNDFLYNFTQFKEMDKNFVPGKIVEEQDEDDVELEDIFVKKTKERKTKKSKAEDDNANVVSETKSDTISS